MNRDEVRLEWVQFRNETNHRARAVKQSQQAIYDLMSHYRSLSEAEKREVDALLIEDLDSTEENTQFDALALIREFKVKSALPALRALADRLEAEQSPSAPYDWAKVNRLIASLTRSDSRPA